MGRRGGTAGVGVGPGSAVGSERRRVVLGVAGGVEAVERVVRRRGVGELQESGFGRVGSQQALGHGAHGHGGPEPGRAGPGSPRSPQSRAEPRRPPTGSALRAAAPRPGDALPAPPRLAKPRPS